MNASHFQALGPPPARASRRMAWLADVASVLAIAGCAALALSVLALTVALQVWPVEAHLVLDDRMAPLIRRGSVLVVEPVQPRDLMVGDIIAYQLPEMSGAVVAQRVASIRAASVPGSPARVFRMSAAPGATDPWEIELHGRAWRAVFVVPLLGYAAALARTPAGTLVFFLAPGAALTVWWMERTWRRLDPRPHRSASDGAAS